jgi:hypothetical protein
MTDRLPPSKDAYSFDPTTREYLCPVLVYLSPEEGTYLLPANVVELPTPATGARQAARLNAGGNAWDIVPNLRSVMLWDIATGRPVPNTLQLGEMPPAGVTAEPPPVFSDTQPLRNVWNPTARAWQQEPDYSRFPVWWKTTGELAPRVPSGRELPDTLTTQCPPTPGIHQAVQWNDEHATWTFVADYRGFTYWTADGVRHVITQLGDPPPTGYLAAPPADAPATTDITTTEG